MDLVAAVIIAIWIMIPAYIPNNIAVLVGGGPPIDGGREWGGARLLGDGKTWRGTIGGILGGMIVAMLQNAFNGPVSIVLGVQLPVFSLAIVAAFPVGALLGDMLASFLKRRTGRERGAAFPGVDQLDFVALALLMGLALDSGWMFAVFDTTLLIIVLVMTPILHVLTNGIAYVLGLKQEPW